MRSDGDQPGIAASEEDPEQAAENGGVLRQIGGAQIQQHTIQAERYAVEPILAVECRVGEHFRRKLGTEQNVGTSTKREMKRADQQNDWCKDLEDGGQSRSLHAWGLPFELTRVRKRAKPAVARRAQRRARQRAWFRRFAVQDGKHSHLPCLLRRLSICSVPCPASDALMSARAEDSPVGAPPRKTVATTEPTPTNKTTRATVRMLSIGASMGRLYVACSATCAA